MSDVAIHIHDVLSFKSCRQSWHFSSELQRGLTSVTPVRYLLLGRAVHAALAAYYHPEKEQTVEALTKAFDAYLDEEWAKRVSMDTFVTEVDAANLAEDAELGRAVLSHYAQWAPKQDAAFDVIAVEVPIWFELPVFVDVQVYYEGTADALVRVRNDKRLWWHEYKTATSFPNESLLFMDEQHLAYLLGARVMTTLMSETVVGSIYTFLRKKAPAVPELLQRGGLSKRKDIDTTYEIYRDTLAQYGLPTTLYGDILNELLTKGNTFFRRTYVERTEQAVETFRANLMHVVKEMLDPTTAIYPSPSWFKCNRCAFRTPCMMVQHGLDPSPVLQQGYVPRKQLVHDNADEGEL